MLKIAIALKWELFLQRHISKISAIAFMYTRSPIRELIAKYQNTAFS